MVNERDANGLYRKAVAAVITAFTGVSDLYEPPAKTALELQADRGTFEDDSLGRQKLGDHDIGSERVLVLGQRGADA